jgi:COMPASS component SWD3
MEGHLAGISTISWSPDSRFIASGSDDKTIRLWDIATGKQHPRVLTGHHNSVFSLAFSPTGAVLVSGSYDEAVFLWDVRTPRLMRSLPAHSDPVAGVDFSLDGTLIVSCAGDGLIRIWDTPTGQCLRTLVHEDMAPVTGVRFSPNGKFVLAWTLDACVRLWRYAEGACVKTYQGHKNEKYSLGGCFGVYYSTGFQVDEPLHGKPDDESAEADPAPRQLRPEALRGQEREKYAFIASGSEDGAVVFWDVQSKEILQRLEGHTAPVLTVDAHPTQSLVVSGSLDQTVRIWSLHASAGGVDPLEARGNDAATTDGISPADMVEAHETGAIADAVVGANQDGGVFEEDREGGSTM